MTTISLVETQQQCFLEYLWPDAPIINDVWYPWFHRNREHICNSAYNYSRRHWGKRFTWPNIPQLNLHGQYPGIFVFRQYLFLVPRSFPRNTLSENCSHLWTNVLANFSAKYFCSRAIGLAYHVCEHFPAKTEEYPRLFFSQASARAGILNPRIWLPNHAQATSPAFYDTAHGPDIFPAVHKFRSSI